MRTSQLASLLLATLVAGCATDAPADREVVLSSGLDDGKADELRGKALSINQLAEVAAAGEVHGTTEVTDETPTSMTVETDLLVIRPGVDRRVVIDVEMASSLSLSDVRFVIGMRARGETELEPIEFSGTVDPLIGGPT